MPNIGDLRVWHMPQIPMESFHVAVASPEQGAALVINTLVRYDLFQLERGVKPDYSNASGLEVYDATGAADGCGAGWVEWHHPDSGDDIGEWMQERAQDPAHAGKTLDQAEA
jgi:hypothetical protein